MKVPATILTMRCVVIAWLSPLILKWTLGILISKIFLANLRNYRCNRHSGRDRRNPDSMDGSEIASLALDTRFLPGMTHMLAWL